MTIQEAIKSGKKFRRPGLDWRAPMHNNYSCLLYCYYADVIATDWEVETIKKELSAEDIRKAAFSINQDTSQSVILIAREVTALIKNLGLE